MNGLVRVLAGFLARVPRPVLFALAGLIQLGLIAFMVIDRAGILREGTEVTLQTRPVDPRDFLRGDYVVLSYDISTVPAGELKGKLPQNRSPTVFVKLAPKDDGFYRAVSAHLDPAPVAGKEILIRGRVTNWRWCSDTLDVHFGLEKFFVPEGEGRELEHARNQRKLSIVAAVTPSGRSAIKRLLLEGKPVYDEPLF
jgi:uncharacterized membrane-anchored protein